MKKIPIWLGLLTVLGLPSAQAANQEIRALFQPDPSQPNKNVFVNKTPNSGYCASHPSECADNQMFSIQVPIRFSTVAPVLANDTVWMVVPAEWRRLTVTNPDTQETSTVEVRISGIGSRFHLSKPVTEIAGEPDLLTAHRKLWTNNTWVYAPPPCLYSGVGYYSPTSYQFFWKTPQTMRSCNKIAGIDVGHMSFDSLDIAYELRTPNPLSMSSGLYTGSLTYSVGRGSVDFSMGPLFDADDSSLTLDFVLDVQHTLKVDLPPGGNKVALEPEGGWQRWIDSGRKPSRIFRDQRFYISASSRFKVMMLCDSLGGSRCRLRSPTGRSTEVETRIYLPAGIDGPGGGSGQTLRFNTWIGPYQPGHYVDRQAGTMRFEMPRDAIDFLVQPGVTDTLSGRITIIFDSEV